MIARWNHCFVISKNLHPGLFERYHATTYVRLLSIAADGPAVNNFFLKFQFITQLVNFPREANSCD